MKCSGKRQLTNYHTLDGDPEIFAGEGSAQDIIFLQTFLCDFFFQV